MSEVIIAADDLTGANAAAMNMYALGLRAVTVQNGDSAAVTALSRKYDAVVVTTDSRHLPAPDAAARTRDVVRAGWPARFVGSRCDSTLRGNIGAEAQAAIAAARELSAGQVFGLCMPAFPGADRQTVHGLQLYGGRRLETTELARDVRSPVTGSSVTAALKRDSQLRTASIDLSVVTAGHDALCEEIDRALNARQPDDAAQAASATASRGAGASHRAGANRSEGADILIADALIDDHLHAVARAAIAVRPEAMWVGIDPGPGSRAIVEQLGLAHTAARLPLLAVSGSATELTRRQLAHVMSHANVSVVRPALTPGTGTIDVAATSASAAHAVRESGTDIVLLGSVIDAGDVVELSEAESAELPVALGEVTARALAASAVDGIYTTGGDITTAVLRALGGLGIEVAEEIVPLATAGTIVGGAHEGLPIATKGGLVGDDETAALCLDRLRMHALKGRR